MRFVFLCVLTAAFAVGLHFPLGNPDLGKVICLISSAVAGAEVCRVTSRSTIRRSIAASAAGAALVFAVVGFYAAITMQMPNAQAPVPKDWAATLSFAVYVAVSAAMFFGLLGGLIGLVYAGVLSLMHRIRP